MKAIILAGGLGTRLKERVPDLPKPMAPVAGRPFLEFILDQLCNSNISDVFLSVGYKSEVIQSHFGQRYRNLDLHYKVESSPLGTGGAIKHVLNGEEPETFLVINGDTFLDISFRNLVTWYFDQPPRIAMVLRSMQDVSRYGSVVVTDSRVTAFREKGECGAGLINAGIYIVPSDAFNGFDLNGAFSLEQDFLQLHIEKLTPRAYISDDWFIDIGVPADFDRAQTELPLVTNKSKNRRIQ